MSLRKPRALRRGDRIAVVAPASAFPREAFDRGVNELRQLGFDPVHDDTVFAVDGYEAGPPETRAAALVRALDDPAVAGIVAVRGGYGSVKVLERLDPARVRRAGKPLVGYSDLTSLLTFVTCNAGTVAFHGPMLDGRLGRGADGYDRASFLAALTDPAPMGEVGNGALEVLAPGEVAGPVYGGTLTQLAASLGTPFAFDPPPGYVLFVEDVNERPYRLDRLLTQLRLAGVLRHAVALVVGQMVGCDEPGGTPTARDTIRRILAGFPGPVVYGFPSGHTTGPALTLPLGVSVRVVAHGAARVVVEEGAVE